MAVSKVIVNGVTKVDLTSDTVAPSNLLASYTAHDASGTAIVGESAGEIFVEDPTPVKFIDYDGTVLYSYSVDDFINLSAMPANPTHSGLISQGWNWTLSDAITTVRRTGALIIGQMYITDDSKTRFYISITDQNNKSLRLCLSVNGTVVIDWGDNTATSSITGVSTSTLYYTDDHTYSTLGNYVITLTVNSGGLLYFGTASSTGSIFYMPSSVVGNTSITNAIDYHTPVKNMLRKIEFGSNIGFRTYAFNNYYFLETVTMPKITKKTELQSNCFANCYSLKCIVIPDIYTSIPSNAFSYCRLLTAVSIPNTIVNINSDPFTHCRSLSLFTIPVDVNISGMLVSENAGIRDIFISQDVSFSSSSNKFYNLFGLKRIKFESGRTYIPPSICSVCAGLTTIDIPETVTSFEDSSFSYSYSLKSIKLPSGLTNISGSVFDGCSSLAKITIPNTVTAIGNNAFKECTALSEVILSNNLQRIGSSAFQHDMVLTNITLPSTVTEIGESAFEYCYGLQTINWPSSIKSIANYTFHYCRSLMNFSCDGITSIGNYAFSECYLLESVNLSNTINTIGQYAFQYCYSLKSVNTLGNITALNASVFSYCYSLQNIVIPSTVTTIGQYAFQYCYSLVTITIPSNVTSIGNYAFYLCRGLREIHFTRSTPPNIGGSATFSGLPAYCKIYVPTGYLSAYTSATNYPSSSTYTYIEE